MKFNIKQIGKSAIDNGKPILVTTAGLIASQKFLDLKTIFPQVDPNKWFIKHEGGLKVLGVAITLSFWTKCPPMLKWLLWGVAIQGAVKETRVLTMNPQGKAFFESIGAGEYDSLISSMADSIQKESSGVSGSDGITDNQYSNVAGMHGGGNAIPQNNSATGVAGMGEDEDY